MRGRTALRMKRVSVSLGGWALSFSTTALVAACSSGSRPPAGGTENLPVPMADAGGSDAIGFAPDATADGSATEAASDSASDVTPEATDDAAPDVGQDAPPAPPLCNPRATWGPGTLLAISTPDLDRFGSISADELSIAWMTPVASSPTTPPDAATPLDGATPADGGSIDTGSAAGPLIYYADRALVTDPFGSPQVLQAIANYPSFGAVALSPDGLTLTIVRSDHLGFGEVTRAARGSPFGPVSEVNFPVINRLRPAVDDPTIAGDGLAFGFSIDGDPGTMDTMHVANRPALGAPWEGWGRTDVEAELLANGAGILRRPTGLAADELTLFFWDEVRGLERAAWRDSLSVRFTTFLDLGPRQFAQPNAACTRIYYSAQGASSVDLFYADAH
jgi:hypothetical protein